MNKLKNYIIEEIKEHLINNEGIEIYFCDLAYKIFEAENVDGSYTYSTFEAKQWIKEYFDELCEIVDELKANFDDNFILNVFGESERFQVIIIIEGASYLLGTCETVEKYWDKEKKLSKYIINKIIKELDEKKTGFNFYN